MVFVTWLLCCGQVLDAQPWVNKTVEKSRNFFELQKTFNKHNDQFKLQNPGKKNGSLKKFKRWEWHVAPRVYPSGDISLIARKYEEFENYRQSPAFLNRFSQQGGDAARVAAANWTSMGPFNNTPVYLGGVGRVDFIRFDPSNNNIMWAGSPSGGLWKSVNGGISWTTNTDFLTVLGCADLAINPANSNIMYLATGDKDHYATNSIGVLKTIDGGTTWNATGLSWPVDYYYRIHKLLIHPTNPNIILAATNVGIYKTTDAGVNWNYIVSGNFTDMEFKPGAAATIYAVSKWDANFWKSTDTGNTFTTITSGLPSVTDVDRYEIAVTLHDPSYVYLIGVNKSNFGMLGLYRSTNSGASFTTRSTSPDAIGGNGWYNLALTVNPFNKNEVHAGGVHYSKSIDGGTTWSTAPLDLLNIHPDFHALEFLPGSATTLFTGNDGGVFKSLNNGITWAPYCNGLAISQIYRLGSSSVDAGVILTGLQDNGSNRLASNAWSWILGGDGMECIVDYTNPDIMYAAYQYGWINKSIDGGATFTPIAYSGGSGIDADGDWNTPYIMHPTNNNTLLVGKAQVFRSTNAGTSWSQVGSLATQPGDRLIALAYAPSNASYIYAATGTQFFTSTNGNTFSDRTGTLPVGSALIRSIAVSNTIPGKVWVTLSGFASGEKVYMSSNAGQTWTNYSAGLPNLPANCIVYQNGSNEALYVGTDVGVYYRDASMTAWQPYFDGLPNVIVNELEIHYGTGKIRAATYGRGLWESPLAAPCATATSFTWTGSVNTAWENPLNWSCGIVPGANSDVIINSGTVMVNSNTSVRSMNIKPGVNFSVQPGFHLTISH